MLLSALRFLARQPRRVFLLIGAPALIANLTVIGVALAVPPPGAAMRADAVLFFGIIGALGAVITLICAWLPGQDLTQAAEAELQP